MEYSLSNIGTKNYLNRTTTVKIIIGWVVSFFETQIFLCVCVPYYLLFYFL